MGGGGKNSVIISIPIYWMSFYKLSNKVKQRIDQLRRRFYGMMTAQLGKKLV
jgi:hypothetical protein